MPKMSLFNIQIFDNSIGLTPYREILSYIKMKKTYDLTEK